jgi:hypothetical protein
MKWFQSLLSNSTCTATQSKPRNPDAPPTQFTVRVKGSRAKEGTKESKEGVVPGYGKVILAVRFDSVEEGGVEEDVVVRLGAPLNRDVVISLRGVGGPVPVHLDGRDVVDFRAVALGCSYRDALAGFGTLHSLYLHHSKHIHLMTASVVHVITLDPPPESG